MKGPLRIAVLECDEPIGKTKEKYDGYGNLFKELLNAGADKVADKDGVQRPELDISKFDVVNHEIYPNLEDVDGILLTGSKFNSFDNDPWILKLVEFTKKVLAQNRVRLIGVCFGHQIIGRALDVKVGRSNDGWEVAVVPVDLTEKGKQLFGIPQLAIHQMHQDTVFAYPSSVEPLGHSPRCQVQGMYSKHRLITVQGHPEFNGDIVSELLERRRESGVFNDHMYNDGMSRVRNHHDGVAVGAAFIRFMMEE
ncbi:class I glutamine amidotransferase-like protein [Hortaea werneckii]|nr:class I glutamine amidotransferase-like protein [Hortaea werneckii]